MKRSELADLLRNHRGCKFASVTYENEPSELYAREHGSRKHAAPRCPAVKKRVAGKNIMLGADYGNRVNNQREREDEQADFTPQAPKGYRHIAGLLAETSTGALAMLYSLPRAGRRNQGTTTYFDKDGDVVAEDRLVNYRKPSRPNGNSQGVQDEIQWRCLKLSNVVAFNYMGKDYEIEDDDEAIVTA